MNVISWYSSKKRAVKGQVSLCIRIDSQSVYCSIAKCMVICEGSDFNSYTFKHSVMGYRQKVKAQIRLRAIRCLSRILKNISQHS